MIKIKNKGSFDSTQLLLEGYKKLFLRKNIFDKYGEIGCKALEYYTPKDTGKTSRSWKYDVEFGAKTVKLYWYNTNKDPNSNTSVAVLIQYGHYTPRGYWVEGRDYINPAMREVFDGMIDEMWEEVTK